MGTRTIVVVGGLARRYITEAEEVPGAGETIETTKPFSSHTGGRGAFTAVAAHRLSHFKPPDGSHVGIESAFPNLKINVHLVATVGDDDAGGRLKERMTECGVNADQVQKVKGASSSRVIVVVDQATKDHRIWFDAAANHILEPDAFKKRGSLDTFAGGRKPALLLTNLELKPQTTEQLIKTAGLDGVEVLLNLVPSHPVLGHVLRNVTHLVIHKAEARRSNEDCPTDDDDPSAWADLAQQYLYNEAKNVVITLSAQVAYFANRFGAAGVVRSNEPVEVNNKVGGGLVSMLVNDCSRSRVRLRMLRRAFREIFIGAYAVEYVRQVSTGECNKEGRWDIEAAVQRGCNAANYLTISPTKVAYTRCPGQMRLASDDYNVYRRRTPLTLLDPTAASTDGSIRSHARSNIYTQ